jgi:hypothetical protein
MPCADTQQVSKAVVTAVRGHVAQRGALPCFESSPAPGPAARASWSSCTHMLWGSDWQMIDAYIVALARHSPTVFVGRILARIRLASRADLDRALARIHRPAASKEHSCSEHFAECESPAGDAGSASHTHQARRLLRVACRNSIGAAPPRKRSTPAPALCSLPTPATAIHTVTRCCSDRSRDRAGRSGARR